MAVVVSVVVWSVAARADEVYLRDGAMLRGTASADGDRIVVATEAGSIAVVRDEVERIEASDSTTTVYERRHEKLRADDVEGRLALARWAKSQRMHRHEQRLMQEVIGIDPDNVEARQALGHRRVDGSWVTDEEFHERNGMVWLDGRWVTRTQARQIEETRYRKAKQANAQAAAREKARARRVSQGQAGSSPKPRSHRRPTCSGAEIYLPGEAHAEWWRERQRQEPRGARPPSTKSDLTGSDWCYGATCARAHPNQQDRLTGSKWCYGGTCRTQ